MIKSSKKNNMKRVDATEKAKNLLQELKEKYGDLMLYKDVCIGEIDNVEFWVDKDLFEYWKYAHFELDVIEAIGAGGFSLEVPLGKTFKVNYTLFTQDELGRLEDVKTNL